MLIFFSLQVKFSKKKKKFFWLDQPFMVFANKCTHLNHICLQKIFVWKFRKFCIILKSFNWFLMKNGDEIMFSFKNFWSSNFHCLTYSALLWVRGVSDNIHRNVTPSYGRLSFLWSVEATKHLLWNASVEQKLFFSCGTFCPNRGGGRRTFVAA